MTKHRRLLLTASGILVAGLAIVMVWHVRWQSVELADAGKPTTFVLTARPGDGWPMGSITGISVWITGDINGQAEMWADNRDRIRLNGTIDLKAYHDWFEPSCHLYFEPQGRVFGKLVVRYKFH